MTIPEENITIQIKTNDEDINSTNSTQGGEDSLSRVENPTTSEAAISESSEKSKKARETKARTHAHSRSLSVDAMLARRKPEELSNEVRGRIEELKAQIKKKQDSGEYNDENYSYKKKNDDKEYSVISDTLELLDTDEYCRKARAVASNKLIPKTPMPTEREVLFESRNDALTKILGEVEKLASIVGGVGSEEKIFKLSSSQAKIYQGEITAREEKIGKIVEEINKLREENPKITEELNSYKKQIHEFLKAATLKELGKKSDKAYPLALAFYQDKGEKLKSVIGNLEETGIKTDNPEIKELLELNENEKPIKSEDIIKILEEIPKLFKELGELKGLKANLNFTSFEKINEELREIIYIDNHFKEKKDANLENTLKTLKEDLAKLKDELERFEKTTSSSAQEPLAEIIKKMLKEITKKYSDIKELAEGLAKKIGIETKERTTFIICRDIELRIEDYKRNYWVEFKKKIVEEEGSCGEQLRKWQKKNNAITLCEIDVGGTVAKQPRPQSAKLLFVGASPTSSSNTPVVQRTECLTSDQKVGGSSPPGRAKIPSQNLVKLIIKVE
ncbi:34487_t:CDS:2 [Racocetra persica]|uniref:34487_t:CDS:1 n=1 Tax=Racocetra persica TaxID=160502 RepID=A0ACA9N1H7_9GLOM|nr:34487_t:CDS:2 [Racocetra persica]